MKQGLGNSPKLAMVQLAIEIVELAMRKGDFPYVNVDQKVGHVGVRGRSLT